MQKDAFYFPHFSNARIDRKIRRMRKELGLEGYGIYFMILETLREQAEYNYPVEDIDLLADEFGTSEQKVRTVITNYELFSIDEQQKFFSPKMIMYLQPYLEGKARKKIGGIKGNLIRYGHLTKEEANAMSEGELLEINDTLSGQISLPSVCESESDRFSSQRKGKEKKVNEIKVNKILIVDHFEEVWKLYPRKEGKGSILKSNEKLKFIKSKTLEEWSILIDRYKNKKPDYQDYQMGSTFFNTGYVDYLDDNYEETTKGGNEIIDIDYNNLKGVF